MLPNHEEVANWIEIKYGKSPYETHIITPIELRQLSGRARLDPSHIEAVRKAVNRNSAFYMTPCEEGVFTLIPRQSAPTNHPGKARRCNGNVQVNRDVYITIRYG